MTFKDLNIGTQLIIGIGIIIVMAVLLGATAIIYEEILWEDTTDLYEHPLQIRRTVGALEADILSIRGGMKDLALTENEQEQEEILQEISINEADAFRQFDILYDRYLGPQSDIDTAYASFVEWNTIREETIRLWREGDIAEAVSRTKSTGVGGAQAETMMGDIQIIDNFARNKADELYQSAQQHKDDLTVQLAALLTITLLLFFVVTYILLKAVRDPILELTDVTSRYGQGDHSARIGIDSPNEVGALATAFNTLAETLQTEMQGRENAAGIAAGIAAVSLKENELQLFCRDMLIVLMEHTDSQVGVVYLLNAQKTEFTLFESIGLSASARTSFSATMHEGEFGAALASREIQHITEIPEETVFTLSTVSGDIRPKDILTIPILSETEVVAIISLANVRAYPAETIGLIDDTQGLITARLIGLLAFQKIQEFSETLEEQNRELNETSRELAFQADELREHNIELDMQKKQLDEANRAKTVFLSNMSHELRTPLNSVIALSGVLNRRLRGTIPEEEYSYIDVILRNGRHLLALINDILDIARIESGREDISLRTFPVPELVSTVVERIGPQAVEKGITLQKQVSPDLPSMTSDFGKCQHILENLVANAVKFTEEGEVTVSATVTDDEVHIAVTDTGIGIPEDRIDIIFDEFRQADERVARQYGGSGLGLSIANKYAILLSGSIAIESMPGKGSTFTLTLPLTITLPMAGTQEATTDWRVGEQGDPAHPSPAHSGVGKTILIVEDSEPAIIQIKDLLEEEGYHIRVARNGKEALEEINRELPDAMILDLMMPEVDGFTVLRMIRSGEQITRIPVLILTAKHITKEELSFLEGNGIHQLIQKGDIDRKSLLAAVERMVSEPVEQVSPKPVQSPRHEVRDRPVILIVEDNADNMMTAQALLREHYTPIGAADGQSGIDMVRKEMPDLVLLDISLPGKDGFEVCRILKQDEELRHIPVIALTARAMKGDRADILSRGFDGYLSKPVDAELLEQTIRRTLYGV
ncbi:hybrid sensor histidine kinase/response regulator [Methanogenium organophilum]|uniref:histidine kinase n=1 Tax=Methanogenium organophilum TaxID=2199 RepID=A0A9X9T9F4_METOG|nr:response regulator [Methanogenium organophilum]WAI02052.1 response regulator [Methanogenium organophilum]